VSSIFFLDLSYSDIVDDIVYDSIFHICDFIPALDCICIYVCYHACYWQPKELMEEISLFVSICWPSSRTHIPYFGKRGVTALKTLEPVPKIWLQPARWKKPEVYISAKTEGMNSETQTRI